MKNQYFGEVKQSVNNVNWKNEMKMDLVKTPNVLPPEPYCSGENGAVIGRCNHLSHNCKNNFDHFPADTSCLCNEESGQIEKCSKFLGLLLQ